THDCRLLHVTMAVDTARRDDAALRVDLPAAGAELRADRRDAAIDDSDVGAEDVGRGCERSVAYDQIVVGHDTSRLEIRSRDDSCQATSRRRPLMLSL